MTKERLEELIKQGATICVREHYRGHDFASVNLATSGWSVGKVHLLLNGIKIYNLKDLYETKEEAEWHHKTYTERLERFNPPMWKKIKDCYFFVFFQKAKHAIFEWKFEVIKGNCSNEGITVYNDFGHIKFQKPATKENYEKACGIVRDLFKGGGNDNI